MSESRAVIFGCAGLELSPAEAAFFADTRPWGFILFGRNIASLDQVAELTGSLRECIGRPDAPVLIDQEGGGCSGSNRRWCRNIPPGRISGHSMERTRKPVCGPPGSLSRLHAFDLYPLGINGQLPAGARCAVTGWTRGHRQPRLRHHAGNRGGDGGCGFGRLEGRRHAAGDQAHSRARPCRG
jgi:hypothetical protein